MGTKVRTRMRVFSPGVPVAFASPAPRGKRTKRATTSRKKKKKTEDERRVQVTEELETVKKVTEETRRRRGLALQYGLTDSKRSKERPTGSGSVPYPGGPGRPPKSAIELQSKEDLYQQLQQTQQRMSSRLRESQLYVRHLEGDLLERDEEIEAHHSRISLLAAEFEHILKTTAELRAGLDGRDTKFDEEKLRILEASTHELSAILRSEEETLTYIKKNAVEISWVGVAEDVKLMGSFDDWSRGEQLSPTDLSGGGGQMEFTAEVLLRPGVYEVKFLIDGRWQLAPQWPMSGKDPVSANNLLVVE